MTDRTNPPNGASHGSYERRDISVAGVVYFLLGLAVSGLIVHFVVSGLSSYLEKRIEAQQAPVSPLVTNAPADTRHLSVGYKDYLKQNFPNPQLETDERGQLDSIRTGEAQELSSYDWIDQKSGTIRIPIDRAMDLIAERGLPARQSGAAEAPTTAAAVAPAKNSKGKKNQ